MNFTFEGVLAREGLLGKPVIHKPMINTRVNPYEPAGGPVWRLAINRKSRDGSVKCGKRVYVRNGKVGPESEGGTLVD